MKIKRPSPLFVERKKLAQIDEPRERRMQDFLEIGLISKNFVWFYETHGYMKKIFRQKVFYSKTKQTLEKIFSLFLLVVLSPLLLGIALFILISDGRPIFYKSPRLGQYGIPFSQLKFRTLSKNATHEITEYNKIQTDSPNQFMLFMRNHKIDELPNLINVLKGEMVLIGPRPIGPDEYEFSMNDGYCLFRLAVKPGITGLWQVTSSKLITGRKRLFRDALYVANRGPLLDLKILALTFRVIFKGEKRIIKDKLLSKQNITQKEAIKGKVA